MIDILMATYNGECFIEKQIVSLIAQTYKEWNLYIHDDGSSDNTLNIIEKYQNIDSRIHVINDNVKCGGAAKNFLSLLRYSKGSYIIFCDQDDIWFESKLEILFKKIKDKEEPIAVYCNAYGYNGIEILTNRVSLIERNNLQNSLFLNSGVQGCSLMFNKVLLEKLKDYPDYIYMHDHYITIGAVTFGKLIYVDKSLMLYRQHTNNVTGNVPIKLFDRVKTFVNRNNTIIDIEHYHANKSFFEKFKSQLSDKEISIFEAYLSFPNLSLLKKIFYILKYDFRIGNSKLILIIKTLIKKAI